jgi:hypothetical protein
VTNKDGQAQLKLDHFWPFSSKELAVLGFKDLKYSNSYSSVRFALILIIWAIIFSILLPTVLTPGDQYIGLVYECEKSLCFLGNFLFQTKNWLLSFPPNFKTFVVSLIYIIGFYAIFLQLYWDIDKLPDFAFSEDGIYARQTYGYVFVDWKDIYSISINSRNRSKLFSEENEKKQNSSTIISFNKYNDSKYRVIPTIPIIAICYLDLFQHDEFEALLAKYGQAHKLGSY